MYALVTPQNKVHRIIPSKFPPQSLFDWAESKEELEQIAALEGLTNDRLLHTYGNLNLVAKEDWQSGIGSTPLMAAFTHLGQPSRFSDATFGVYYAANTQRAAIKETIFHRERFYTASKESACVLTMREYIAYVQKPLVDLRDKDYHYLLDPNPKHYTLSQTLGRKLRDEQHFGLIYPSVRDETAECVAIFRPIALTIPTQGTHFEYVWDGFSICTVHKVHKIRQ